MIRRPPRSTLDRSSAASDVYKRQDVYEVPEGWSILVENNQEVAVGGTLAESGDEIISVSYTHLRAHETVLDIVCRLLLEKKTNHTM